VWQCPGKPKKRGAEKKKSRGAEVYPPGNRNAEEKDVHSQKGGRQNNELLPQGWNLNEGLEHEKKRY